MGKSTQVPTTAREELASAYLLWKDTNNPAAALLAITKFLDWGVPLSGELTEWLHTKLKIWVAENSNLEKTLLETGKGKNAPRTELERHQHKHKLCIEVTILRKAFNLAMEQACECSAARLEAIAELARNNDIPVREEVVYEPETIEKFYREMTAPKYWQDFITEPASYTAIEKETIRTRFPQHIQDIYLNAS